MKNKIATWVLRNFFDNYLISLELPLPYSQGLSMVVTIDLGKFANDDEEAIDFEVIKDAGPYIN